MAEIRHLLALLLIFGAVLLLLPVFGESTSSGGVSVPVPVVSSMSGGTSAAVAEAPVSSGFLPTIVAPDFEPDIQRCILELKNLTPGIDEHMIMVKCRTIYSPKVQVVGSVSTQPLPECAKIDEEFMRKLKEAMARAELIKANGTEEELKFLEEDITAMRARIEENKKSCWQPQLVRAVEISTVPECEIIIEKLKIELDGAFKKLHIAKQEGAKNDTLKPIEAYIEKIKLKITEKSRDCARASASAASGGMGMPTIAAVVSSDTKPADLETYYQARMDRILSEGGGVESQIEGLKALRSEIDAVIEELIKKKQSIDSESFEGVVDSFIIRPGEIIAGNITVSTIEKEVFRKIEGRNVTVLPANQTVILKVGGIEVDTTEVELGESLMVEKLRLKVLPDEIKANIEAEGVISTNLSKEGERLVYNIKSSENRKLFWFFKVKAEKNVKIDASSETPKVISEEAPWWYILSTK